MKFFAKVFLTLLLAIEFFCASSARAQETLQVSNTGQSTTGSLAIGTDSWIAQRIVSGTDPGGYALDSIDLLMNTASGSPAGFTVSIYSFNNNNFQPSSDLGNLVGSSPSAAGVYNFASSGLTLLPSTIYYVMLTSGTPISQGAYNWSSSGVALGNNQWQISDPSLTSPNGSSWTFNPRGDDFQMAIYATPIPEPSGFWLCSSGAVAFTLYRRITRNRAALC